MATVESLSASISVYSPSVCAIQINSLYPNGNFTGDCVVRNSYFDYRSSCFNNEKKLYNQLLTGYINNHGVKLTFFVVDYNTSYNSIFGEDSDRTVVRKFPIMGMFELPQQERVGNVFGIDEIDTFHIHVSKKHFESASKLNHLGSQSAGYVYPSYEPKAGDVLKANYNNTYYQVLDCRGERDTQFLQEKHSWDMTVRVMRNNHYSLSAATSATMTDISAELLVSTDILSNNAYVDTKTSAILYTSASTEGSTVTNNPFGDW
jgi:hypothetical protein